MSNHDASEVVLVRGLHANLLDAALGERQGLTVVSRTCREADPVAEGADHWLRGDR